MPSLPTSTSPNGRSWRGSRSPNPSPERPTRVGHGPVRRVDYPGNADHGRRLTGLGDDSHKTEEDGYRLTIARFGALVFVGDAVLIFAAAAIGTLRLTMRRTTAITDDTVIIRVAGSAEISWR